MDNGTEFLNRPFCSHLQKCGIGLQLSCPYTPNQNGVAERKQRHITEVGRALLLQSGLSPSYWVEAFSTAVFIINRLPTPRLNHRSPFSILHHRQPDYTLFHSFGCLCFPLLPPHLKNKLSPRSLPCVFLGYASEHHVYRCLHLPTNRIYVSQHVLFHETEFPLLSLSSEFSPPKITRPMSEFRPFLPHTGPDTSSIPSTNTKSLFPEPLKSTLLIPSTNNPTSVSTNQLPAPINTLANFSLPPVTDPTNTCSSNHDSLSDTLSPPPPLITSKITPSSTSDTASPDSTTPPQRFRSIASVMADTRHPIPRAFHSHLRESEIEPSTYIQESKHTLSRP